MMMGTGFPTSRTMYAPAGPGWIGAKVKPIMTPQASVKNPVMLLNTVSFSFSHPPCATADEPPIPHRRGGRCYVELFDLLPDDDAVLWRIFKRALKRQQPKLWKGVQALLKKLDAPPSRTRDNDHPRRRPGQRSKGDERGKGSVFGVGRESR